MIVADASIDVEIQLAAVKSGEKNMAYFPRRTLSDMPGHTIGLGVADGGNWGTVVFNQGTDIVAFVVDQRHKGLEKALALWLGYEKWTKEPGDVVVTVWRDGGVVHDECVRPEDAISRMMDLSRRFPHHLISRLTPAEALKARIDRYSDEDRNRFTVPKEIAERL